MSQSQDATEFVTPLEGELSACAADTATPLPDLPQQPCGDLPAKLLEPEEEIPDADQIDLIERSNDKSMLVTGPAGCGKSLIAVRKARQLIDAG